MLIKRDESYTLDSHNLVKQNVLENLRISYGNKKALEIYKMIFKGE